MKQLDDLKQNFYNLGERDQKLLVTMIALLVVTLFYIGIWEPIHLSLEKQKADQLTQTEIYGWMQNAAVEARQLKSSGSKPGRISKTNSPVSIVAEQSARTSGLKDRIGKIESSGKDRAQVKVDNAQFNQMLLWINTLKTRYGIHVASAKIERTDKDGFINARLSLSRS